MSTHLYASTMRRQNGYQTSDTLTVHVEDKINWFVHVDEIYAKVQ